MRGEAAEKDKIIQELRDRVKGVEEKLRQNTSRLEKNAANAFQEKLAEKKRRGEAKT